MKIDFHVHTSEYSRCADSTLEEQVYSALEKGLNALFITDHMTLHPMERLEAFNDLYAPFKLYQGVEITLRGDNYEDILVLGVHDKKLETSEWDYTSLYKFVHSRGGVMILAHPYRFSDRIDSGIWDQPPEGVEVLSNNIGSYGYERRKALANQLQTVMTSNSDSHHYSSIGSFYNDFPDDCTDEKAILKALVEGNFTCLEPSDG